MQRFYRAVYRLDKSDDAGSLVERIAQAATASGQANHRISFAFTDAVLRGQKSALDYLVKCYPVFIPRRFAFGKAAFAWRGIPALEFTPELAAPDNSVAGIYGTLAGRKAVRTLHVRTTCGG